MSSAHTGQAGSGAIPWDGVVGHGWASQSQSPVPGVGDPTPGRHFYFSSNTQGHRIGQGSLDALAAQHRPWRAMCRFVSVVAVSPFHAQWSH